MKRILVLASSAALVLSGCNKVDHLKDGSSPTASTVSFSTYLGGKTKGLEKTDFKMGDQFFTYGVKTVADFDVKSPAFTDYVFVGSSPLDHGITVTHMGMSGVNSIWEYNEVAPWDDKKATFFAVSPVPQGAQTYGVTLKPIAPNTLPAIDFEVSGGYATGATDADILAASEKIKDQADLMWAYSPDNVKTGGVIQMPFNHALSQLSFSVKAYHTSGILRVNSITLKKVNTKGTLALAHDESKKGAVDYLGGWSATTAAQNFAVNLLTEKVALIDPFVPTASVTEPVKINITDNDEALMMIPQALTDIGLEVRYSYSLDGVVWDNYESGTALDYVLAKYSSHWNPNMRYNYCLHINPGKAITFDADIKEWDPINSTVDMEYRTFDAKATEQTLIAADGTDVQFEFKEGDKLSVEYVYDPAVTNGMEWATYTTSAGGATAKILSAAAALTVTAADAGNWKLGVDKNFYPNARKAVITVNRAPYKKMVNGAEVSFSAGVAKYIITQATAGAPYVLYGNTGLNGGVTTGLLGATTVSYPNELGTKGYANSVAAIAAEKPYARFRVAKNNASASLFPLSDIIAACANYSEEGMPAGKWRLPRASELYLIYLNKAAINLQLTDKLTEDYHWSATAYTSAGACITVNLTTGERSTGQSYSYYIRCVAEE